MNENIKNIISSNIADVVFKPIVGETTTFYKDPNIKDWAESEYAWCERPCDSNMSMRAIDKKGSIVGYASEHYWTWCDVKEVKKVSAIEFMRHFASKQSETVEPCEVCSNAGLYDNNQEIKAWLYGEYLDEALRPKHKTSIEIKYCPSCGRKLLNVPKMKKPK